MLEMISVETLGYITSASVDMLAIGAIVIFLVALGFAKGKGELLAFFLSVFPAAFLTVIFPYEGLIPYNGPHASVYEELTIFIAFFVLIGLTVRNYVEGGFPRSSFWRFIEIVGLSLAIMAALLAIMIHMLQVDTIYGFSPLVLTAFNGPLALFWWLIGSLVVIPLFVRR
jgi:hypothetical protein